MVSLAQPGPLDQQDNLVSVERPAQLEVLDEMVEEERQDLPDHLDLPALLDKEERLAQLGHLVNEEVLALPEAEESLGSVENLELPVVQDDQVNVANPAPLGLQDNQDLLDLQGPVERQAHEANLAPEESLDHPVVQVSTLMFSLITVFWCYYCILGYISHDDIHLYSKRVKFLV